MTDKRRVSRTLKRRAIHRLLDYRKAWETMTWEEKAGFEFEEILEEIAKELRP